MRNDLIIRSIIVTTCVVIYGYDEAQIGISEALMDTKHSFFYEGIIKLYYYGLMPLAAFLSMVIFDLVSWALFGCKPVFINEFFNTDFGHNEAES